MCQFICEFNVNALCDSVLLRVYQFCDENALEIDLSFLLMVPDTSSLSFTGDEKNLEFLHRIEKFIDTCLFKSELNLARQIADILPQVTFKSLIFCERAWKNALEFNFLELPYVPSENQDGCIGDH